MVSTYGCVKISKTCLRRDAVSKYLKEQGVDSRTVGSEPLNSISPQEHKTYVSLGKMWSLDLLLVKEKANLIRSLCCIKQRANELLGALHYVKHELNVSHVQFYQLSVARFL